MSKRFSSPRQLRSGSQLEADVDGNSTHGAGSVYGSVIGHDDATAVMGNIHRSDGSSCNLRSSGTIDSFVTTEHSRGTDHSRGIEHSQGTDCTRVADHTRENSSRIGGPGSLDQSQELKEVREPPEGPRETLSTIKKVLQIQEAEDKDLREQLDELDRAEEEWQARMSKKDSLVTEDFYVTEVGSSEPLQIRRFKQLQELESPLNVREPKLILEQLEQLENDILVHHVEEDIVAPDCPSIESTGSNSPTTDSNSSKMSANTSCDGGSASISSDQSLKSGEAFSAVKVLPPEDDVSSDNPDNESLITPVVLSDAIGRELEGDEVIMQVQRRLIASQDNIIDQGSVTDQESLVDQGSHFDAGSVNDQGSLFEQESQLRERLSPSSNKSGGKYRPWIPVDDDDGFGKKSRRRGLAAASSDVSDEEFNGTSKYQSRRKRLCILFTFVLVVIITILVLVLTREYKPAKPQNSVNDGQQTEGGYFLRTSAPTTAPKTVSTKIPAIEVRDPSATPSLRPKPTGTFKPTESPVSSHPNYQASNQPSSPPSYQQKSAFDKLYLLSGDLLYDTGSPQYQAYQWLVNDDPAQLDLDTLPDQVLIERYVASLLYFSTEGTNWQSSFGFLHETSVCKWQDESGKGIRCNQTETISEISLNENNLQGSIPFELKELKSLTVLELRGNILKGTIPQQLGVLSAIEVFDLRQNQLSGSVPEAIFSLPELKKLFLLRNSRLSGTIPPSINLATNLEMLSFQRCHLSGTLPNTLGELSKLSFLTLMDNSLTGTIPDGLSSLPLLEVLELSGNKLTGGIPVFAGQSDLYFISLAGNYLVGTIPEPITTLPGLLFLDLKDNVLTGTVPNAIGEIPFLVTFFASNNQLIGTIPRFNGNNGLLQALHLDNNRLTGNIEGIFSETGPAARLLSIDLSSNKLNGTIPSAIERYTALMDLVLAKNVLSGSIPDEIQGFSDFHTLSLASNNLTGLIPEELGSLKKMAYLDLSNNTLTGYIPNNLSMLSKLSELDLSSNKLSGSLPESWTTLKDIDALHLNFNNLTGDFSPILCPTGDRPRPIQHISADCGTPNPEVVCSCCTTCCNDRSGICVERNFRT